MANHPLHITPAPKANFGFLLDENLKIVTLTGELVAKNANHLLGQPVSSFLNQPLYRFVSKAVADTFNYNSNYSFDDIEIKWGKNLNLFNINFKPCKRLGSLGNLVFVEINASAYSDKSSKKTEALSAVAQLQKEIESSLLLQQQLLQANERYQTLETFFYGLIHDLKSPVNQILGILSLLDPTLKQNELLAMLEVSANRLNGTVLAMIEMAKVEREHTDNSEKIELRQIIDKILADFAPDLKSKGAKISLNIAVDFIKYPRGILESILSNLVSNAIKYAKPDQNLTLVITAHNANDDKVELIVADNGIGIDLDAAKGKMFSPFKRMVSSGEGHGLGLYIIKRMIERNGGKITVNSKPHIGTAFICELKPY